MPVALATVLVLAGCGRSSGTDASAAAGRLDSGPATGTVTIWAQGAEADALPAVLKDFQAANPQVKVNVTAIPWDSAHDKYQTGIAAGTTPDIGQIGTTWMGEFGGTGAFDPTPTNVDTAGFYPGSLDSTRVAGGTFGVPWYVDTPLLYYRTDLATRAGYTAPPKTWDDLKAMARAMQQRAGAKYGIALGPHDFQGFLPWAWSAGASLTTPDGKKWTLDSPEMVRAVKAYQSFFTEGVANKAPSTDTGAYEGDFIKGTVPMFIGGPSEVGALAKAGGADFAGKYATAVLPADRTSTSFVGGSDLVVFKQSKNRTAAWKVIQYLSKAQTQVTWYQKTGDLPATQAAWSLAPLSSDPKLAVFGRQLKSVKSPPPTTAWTQVQAAGNSVMEKVTVSGLDPAQAMRQLQATADSIGTGS